LAEDFLADLCADWKQHGTSVIADVRMAYPAVYLRTVALLVPRDEKMEITHKKDHLDALSGRELAVEYARVAQELLADYSKDEESSEESEE
jgi:hypothetical protein